MAKNDAGVTPMMKQFYDLKGKHPDALLLFRCGDFYETYDADAVEAAKILGITLTQRSKTIKSDAIQMAGFPYHALDTYLPKLIRAGRRVAICDQLEDPKLTKKLVKRGITELVTPGVAMSDNVLENKENNFLAAIHFGKGMCGLSLLDISTGEFLVGEGSFQYIDKLLTNFQPKEILYERSKKADFERYFSAKHCTFELDEWAFNYQTACEKLINHFQTHSLKGFGVGKMECGIAACGAIMQYLELTQHTQLGHVTSLSRIEGDNFVRLDTFTIRSLELLHPMHEGGTSLLDVIDKTTTPMGARLLKRWIVFPLKDVKAIEERLSVVENFFRSPDERQALGEQLQQVGDLERIVSRISTMRATPRDVVALKIAMQSVALIKDVCSRSDNSQLSAMAARLDACHDITSRIEREIEPAPLQTTAKGGVIRSGVNTELDELRRIAFSGKDYLLQIQQREIEQTGIQSLKIGYNNVFGYYLEVRNTYKDHVPDTWIRKQTLAQAERYITEELKQYEEKILGAEEKILALEARIFSDLLIALQPFVAAVQTDASVVAQIDVLLGFAYAAAEYKYIRPVVDESLTLDIRQGRHPVIERQMPVGESYVPNDILLDTRRQQIMIITGPNMAGKSALLRQTALITLMAQIGSFVPAESAKIGLVDKIFTRVGASDNISLGESTFMVEMTEASDILNNVSERSLVLFDELGRGTSTYDGISIAWAIVEYLHDHGTAHPRTLFATHYHELNEMERSFKRIKNYNVSVREIDGRIIFLRKLVEGGSEHSFGIHVAEIAGMPKSIVKRAKAVLKHLEQGSGKSADSSGKSNRVPVPLEGTGEGVQLSFFQLDDPVLCQIRDEIAGLDINNLTPMEALNKLSDIKKIVTGK